MTGGLLYVMDAEGSPVPCDDIETWGVFMATEARSIGDDTVGDTRVSTVFLGVDHAPLRREGRQPVVFETMTFREDGDYRVIARYRTRAEAEAGHAAALADVRHAAATKARVIPIAAIRRRQADPTLFDRANTRARAISAALRPHKAKMEALANQAIRAKNTGAKVKALRDMLAYVARAAEGLTACGKGCGSCCHVAVTVSAEEAAIIGKEIGITPAKAAGLAPNRAGRDETAAEHYGTPCPFLVDDQCSIYESRPLACRTLYNVDIDALLCTVVPDDPPKVTYLDHSQFTMIIAQAFMASAFNHADIRDYFPNGKGGKA